MSGFPIRTGRTDFGPKPVNKRPVRDPSRELDANIGHLMFHQVAGCSVVACLAWLKTNIVAGPDVAIAARAEAWNPDDIQTGSYVPPAVARTGVGVYTVDYASTYPDELGELQSLLVSGRYAKVQPDTGSAAGYVFSEHVEIDGSPPANTIRLNVRTYQWQIGVSADWAAADLPFLLTIW